MRTPEGERAAVLAVEYRVALVCVADDSRRLWIVAPDAEHHCVATGNYADDGAHRWSNTFVGFDLCQLDGVGGHPRLIVDSAITRHE